MHSTVDARTQAFREHYRAHWRPAGYRGRWHVAAVALIGGALLAGALAFAWRHGLQAVHLWVVPATLLLANVVEYLAHRGPMHHPVRPLGALHTRHSARHHRYFTHEAMSFESPGDFHAVLFPPVLLLFFGGITVGLGVLAALVLPPAAAALFVASGVAYYLGYEVLHFCYHLPATHWAARLPGVRWLARLHHLHHEPRRMQQRNFNLVFPLCDWIAGTLDTGRDRAVAGTHATPERSPR